MKIPISSILETDRQRKDFGDLKSLADSIQKYGCIHPPCVSERPDGLFDLVAGGRRLAAHRLLGVSHLEVTIRQELSLEDLHELELEENLRRKDITWQERVLAIDDLHEKRSRKAALESSPWFIEHTAEMLGVTKGGVFPALRIAKHLRKDTEKKGIWQCDGVVDALKWVLKKQVDEAQAELAKRTILRATTPEIPQYGGLLNSESPVIVPNTSGDVEQPSTFIPPKTLIRQNAPIERIREAYLTNPVNPPEEFDAYVDYCRAQIAAETKDTVYLTRMLHNTSCLTFMHDQGESWCDHIITDPPYAIDMDMLEQASGGIENIDSVRAEHDEDENKDLLKAFIHESFSSLRENGFIVFWLDQSQWQMCYDFAIFCGFKVQRWPLTWHKLSSCKNGAAYKNFTKNTEIAMVCRKGNATLVQTSSSSVISASHDSMRDEFGHPFVKPFAVWEFIAQHVASPGQLIYEPFSGRGSGVISLLRMGYRVLATEKQENHFNHLLLNVKAYYTKTLGEENVIYK